MASKKGTAISAWWCGLDDEHAVAVAIKKIGAGGSFCCIKGVTEPHKTKNVAIHPKVGKKVSQKLFNFATSVNG